MLPNVACWKFIAFMGSFCYSIRFCKERFETYNRLVPTIVPWGYCELKIYLKKTCKKKENKTILLKGHHKKTDHLTKSQILKCVAIQAQKQCDVVVWLRVSLADCASFPGAPNPTHRVGLGRTDQSSSCCGGFPLSQESKKATKCFKKSKEERFISLVRLFKAEKRS